MASHWLRQIIFIQSLTYNNKHVEITIQWFRWRLTWSGNNSFPGTVDSNKGLSKAKAVIKGLNMLYDSEIKVASVSSTLPITK